MSDFDALLLADLFVLGVPAVLAFLGVLTFKAELKWPTPRQPPRTRRSQPMEPAADPESERDPWDPDDAPF